MLRSNGGAAIFALVVFVGVPFYIAGYVSARWGEQRRKDR